MSINVLYKYDTKYTKSYSLYIANSCMRGSRKFDKGWKLHNNSIHEKASKMLNLLKLV